MLKTGTSVSIDIVYQDVALVVSGAEGDIDLGSRAARRLAEQAAIVVLGGIDVDMLNL